MYKFYKIAHKVAGFEPIASHIKFPSDIFDRFIEHT